MQQIFTTQIHTDATLAHYCYTTTTILQPTGLCPGLPGWPVSER